MVAELFDAKFKFFKDPFKITPPTIDSGATYHFVAGSGLLYEVTFGRKQDNYLHHIINFSVISDEFDEEEYPVTNKGELYRIIATLIEIVRLFHTHHPHTQRYELTGEFKEKKDTLEASIRTRLYYRFAKNVISHRWQVKINKNTVIVEKKIHE